MNHCDQVICLRSAVASLSRIWQLFGVAFDVFLIFSNIAWLFYPIDGLPVVIGCFQSSLFVPTTFCFHLHLIYNSVFTSLLEYIVRFHFTVLLSFYFVRALLNSVVPLHYTARSRKLIANALIGQVWSVFSMDMSPLGAIWAYKVSLPKYPKYLQAIHWLYLALGCYCRILCSDWFVTHVFFAASGENKQSGFRCGLYTVCSNLCIWLAPFFSRLHSVGNCHRKRSDTATPFLGAQVSFSAPKFYGRKRNKTTEFGHIFFHFDAHIIFICCIQA